ncbi:unnamed protein product, partial [Rotaria sp. Silwood2]
IKQIIKQSTQNSDHVIINANCWISNEADVDFDVYVIDDENATLDNRNYFKTNSIHCVSEYENDLNHGSKEQLSKSEERLELNILRLLINL